MPTEGVKNRAFKDIFSGMVRFEIPFFQRGYVWGKKQWDDLFDDLDKQILSDLNDGKHIEQVEHFFGPIVVVERTGGSDQLKEFLVVDGQQRITTIYIVLAIIRSAMKAQKHLSGTATEYAHKLEKYLTNDVDSNDDYLKLKVFSSKGDRLPTYKTVFGADANPKTPYLATDMQLYLVGKNRVDELHKYAAKKLKADYPDIQALWQLAQALLSCLKVVWIPLDASKDDPQAIFESLNDKGQPLSASELLCNFLFQPIIDAKEPYEDLHNNQWLDSIRLLEDTEAFEEYLRYLFSIGESKMVGKNRKIYIHFKSKNPKLNVASAKHHLADIRACAPFYRTITDPRGHPHKDEQINKVLIDISDTRMDSSRPFVLGVLKACATGRLNSESTLEILRETMVLLVRRKVTELSTTQYDVMFPQLLGKILDEIDKIQALQDQFKKHSVWIADQEFKEALIKKPTYRSRDLSFSRMLLIGIDKKLQSHGQLPDYTTLGTIEHTLPQKLDAVWKNYLGSDSDDEHLEDVVNSIGNLCLLSAPANSSAGQNPFEAKRAGYSQLTALARQIKEYNGTWNVAAIRERSAKLADIANEVWKWAGT